MSSLDSLINKATDATLTQDNWQYNLDVCDKILEDPEQYCSKAIDALRFKLSLKDGNVLLRSLTLLVAIAENCGSRAQQLIATKSFMQLLLSKMRDPQTHREIKTKITTVLAQLDDSFHRDPSLKPVSEAYREVKLSFPQYLAPTKPQKFELKDEDADLRTAIELSLRESQRQQPLPEIPQVECQPQAQPQAQSQAQAQPQAQSQAQQPQRTFSRVRALYDSFSNDPADLKFHKGDVITVIERVYKDWGKGSLRGVIGLFPFNYVTPLYDPTPEELMQEQLKEQEILSRSADVEKLLVLLTRASNDEESLALTQSEEFKTLYQRVVLIKPELATLIDKYRQRKDDLMDLYGKLKTATISYEEMTDPIKQQQYHYTQQYQQQQQTGYQQQQVQQQTGYAQQQAQLQQTGYPQQQQTGQQQVPSQATGNYQQSLNYQQAPYPR